MRHVIPISVLGLIIILISAFGVAARLSAAAPMLIQTDTTGQGIVGSWQLMGAGAPGTPQEDPMLATFLPDGLLTISARAVRPALPEMPFDYMHFSTGHGVWEQDEDGAVAFTVVHLRSDEAGVFRGSVTFSGSLSLEGDGQMVSGDATYTVADPTGAVQGTIPTSLSGERIGIEVAAPSPVAGPLLPA